MAEHELKTWSRSFNAIVQGTKTAEMRRDDRGGYAVGDVLHLREWDTLRDNYTGKQVDVIVTDVERDARFGIPDGYAMLTIRVPGFNEIRVPMGAPFFMAVFQGAGSALFETHENDGRGGTVSNASLSALCFWLNVRTARRFERDIDVRDAGSGPMSAQDVLARLPPAGGRH